MKEEKEKKKEKKNEKEEEKKEEKSKAPHITPRQIRFERLQQGAQKCT